MQIQPITELSYNQATMTFAAMRQELLLYREELAKLKKKNEELTTALQNNQADNKV